MRTLRWLLVLLLTLSGPVVLKGQAPLAPNRSAPPPALADAAAAKPPWGRILLVGASATAGFTETEMLGGTNSARYRLSRYLDAALLAPHEPVRNLASTWFFLKPEAHGRQQINQVLQAKPTLVVGLDFLFWFCYGEGLTTDAERLQRFEQGLKLLEAVPCPLVIGDIPDASAAVNGMLTADQLPSARAMARANRRLKEWAAARKQVTVIPLSQFMRAAMANRALTIHGLTLAEGTTRRLLQNDKLHPSALGSATLALTVLDSFLATHPAVPASEVRWDARELLRLGLNYPPATPAHPAKPDLAPLPGNKP